MSPGCRAGCLGTRQTERTDAPRLQVEVTCLCNRGMVTGTCSSPRGRGVFGRLDDPCVCKVRARTGAFTQIQNQTHARVMEHFHPLLWRPQAARALPAPFSLPSPLCLPTLGRAGGRWGCRAPADPPAAPRTRSPSPH